MPKNVEALRARLYALVDPSRVSSQFGPPAIYMAVARDAVSAYATSTSMEEFDDRYEQLTATTLQRVSNPHSRGNIKGTVMECILLCLLEGLIGWDD